MLLRNGGAFRLGARLTVGNNQLGVTGTFKLPNFEKINQSNSLKLNNNLFYSKYSYYSTATSSNVQEAAKNILENSEIKTVPTTVTEATNPTLNNSSTVLSNITEETAKREELEKIINQLQQATEVIGTNVDPISTFDISKWYHFFARGLVATYEISQPYMGWWFLILATAGFIRIISFPMNLISMKYYCKSKLEEPNIAQIRNKYMDQMAKEPSMPARTKLQSQMRTETKNYLASRGIHSYQAFYSILIGLPVLVYIGVETRLLASVNYPGMSSEGLFWFKDLTVPDPYYILPLLYTFSIFVAINLQTTLAKRNGLVVSRLDEYMAYAVSFLMFTIFFYIGMKLIAGVQLYIFATSMLSLSTTFLWRMRAVRRIFNLPPIAGLRFSMIHSDPAKIKELFRKDNFVYKRTIVAVPQKKEGILKSFSPTQFVRRLFGADKK